jgi:hypothetical protein
LGARDGDLVGLPSSHGQGCETDIMKRQSVRHTMLRTMNDATIGGSNANDEELVFIDCEVPPPKADLDREAQVASRRAASHHGDEWTSEELDIVRRNPNNEQVAKQLGRTVHAVANQRSGLRE